jgi:O-antigen/teichoic acid export membrane protein
MIEYVITFFALFFTDIFYTYYLRSVQNNEALKSSLWAVIVFFIAAMAVVNYTTDHMLLIPACLGAFCGTYVGMKIRKR